MKKGRSLRKGPFQVAVLGCMAERLKTDLLEREKWVDVGTFGLIQTLYIRMFGSNPNPINKLVKLPVPTATRIYRDFLL